MPRQGHALSAQEQGVRCRGKAMHSVHRSRGGGAEAKPCTQCAGAWGAVPRQGHALSCLLTVLPHQVRMGERPNVAYSTVLFSRNGVHSRTPDSMWRTMLARSMTV